MLMLMAFTSLQGGKPHLWFSRCTPLRAALLPPPLLSLKAPPTRSTAQTSPQLAAKHQTPSCRSSTESGFHAAQHQAPAGRDAAAHTGRARVSPSIRGNAWARDQGSQEGLKEAGGQQKFRKRLCSLSRNVAKALIPLQLTITLKLFLSTLVSGGTSNNHIRRHHGAGGTHRAGAKLSCATCHNLIATSTSKRCFLLMLSLAIPPDSGSAPAQGNLKGGCWRNGSVGLVCSHGMGIMPATHSAKNPAAGGEAACPARRSKRCPGSAPHCCQHMQGASPAPPATGLRIPPAAQGQIHCFEAPPKMHPTALP